MTKPRVSDACANRPDRCEWCVHWSSGVSLWDDWVRKCGGGHQCTRGMSCRDFVPADPHASGRLF